MLGYAVAVLNLNISENHWKDELMVHWLKTAILDLNCTFNYTYSVIKK